MGLITPSESFMSSTRDSPFSCFDTVYCSSPSYLFSSSSPYLFCSFPSSLPCFILIQVSSSCLVTFQMFRVINHTVPHPPARRRSVIELVNRVIKSVTSIIFTIFFVEVNRPLDSTKPHSRMTRLLVFLLAVCSARAFILPFATKRPIVNFDGPYCHSCEVGIRNTPDIAISDDN